MLKRIRAYELAAGSKSFEGLRQTERPKPVPAPHEVLVRMRTASLNFRDILIATDRYFRGPIARDTIPLSDGAGEVEAVGGEVRHFRPGERVVATFKQRGTALGVPLDGTLTEYAVFNEDGLLSIPEGLTFEEAATLPVAGVTAWNALCDGRPIRPGDTVLTLGTGGVSVFAMQIAKASGARVIVTSSSDEKLARVKRLGVSELINHARQSEWASIVGDLTGGAGVEQVVELFGAATLSQSYRAVGEGGEIALIAESTQAMGGLEPYALIRKGATLRGIACGDKGHFRSLVAAISINGIKPVIESVYPFDCAVDAYYDLRACRHIGKLVIRIQD